MDGYFPTSVENSKLGSHCELEFPVVPLQNFQNVDAAVETGCTYTEMKDSWGQIYI